MSQIKSRTAARVLVDQLVIQGIDRVFCVPGESFLAVLDALYETPEIELVTCRHEGGAAMMAEAYGKLTGRPGVVFCSRGPGASNASSGLHVAFQDSTPFIMFIGQNPRDVLDREGFQEIDYRRIYGTQAKAVLQIDDGARTSEFVTRAFQLAITGRRGPVVVALPEDMLTDSVSCPDGRATESFENGPSSSVIASVRKLVATAKEPIILLGGGDWQPEEVALFREFVEECGLSVCASFRRQDLFDNQSPNYIGEIGLGANPKLVKRVQNADVLLVIGARLGEIGTFGYTIMDTPTPRQTLIHVYPDPDELGHVYQPALGVVSRAGTFAAALAQSGALNGDWSAEREQARADFDEWTAPCSIPGAIQMYDIMTWLDDNMPEDTIYTNGAGNFSVWLHRYHRYRYFGTQVAPVCGSMGYGIPAALAAKFACPKSTVICFAGDGDFQMTCTEIATAVAHGLNIRILILNNGMLGTIRMHQERNFPGRVSGTQLDVGNPDFCAFARAYGAFGEKVVRTEDFATAFARAEAFDGPAILEIMIDPEAITPNTSLSALRQAAAERANS